MTLLSGGQSLAPAAASNLFTFLAMRGQASFVNLGCGALLNQANPITLTLTGGVVTAATFTAGTPGTTTATPTMTGSPTVSPTVTPTPRPTRRRGPGAGAQAAVVMTPTA